MATKLTKRLQITSYNKMFFIKKAKKAKQKRSYDYYFNSAKPL
jgi:hypothetical protein